jgi:hexosaminidase
MQRYSILLLVLLVFSCKNVSETPDQATLNVIPRPVSYEGNATSFTLSAETAIRTSSDNNEVQKIAEYLASKLRPATGYKLEVGSAGQERKSGDITLSLAADESLGDEGYTLSVNDEGVNLSANKPAGLFRGVQSLRQLLPAGIEKTTRQDGEWTVAGGTIRDMPSYPFRGAMLDVSRHFFGVDDVKRYIDLISFYKMNVLHLHLSDDQGWRIEIKSWPNLTAIGSNSEVGEGKGGFYTQEQYKDIVNYAADRYITIIPEIDMPGHTNAALASYPELNCSGKSPELYRGIEVGFSTLCVNKDITYKFIDDVVKELAAMTPGPYIHLGGDESHATKHEDYIVFVEKAQEIVERNGKKMIGWEEVAQSKLQPNTVIQFWASPKHAQDAVKKGAKIIMSPAKKVYLDMKYDSTTKIGLDWAARIEVDSSYNWNPANYVQGIARENILGIETPLWSETVTNMEDIEYLVFPRLPGIAELAWSPSNALNWEEYRVRLGKHAPRFKAMDINYYESKLVPWSK